MSTLRPKSALLAALLATVCVAGVHAQDAATPAENPKRVEKFAEKFDAADSDHDGFSDEGRSS